MSSATKNGGLIHENGDLTDNQWGFTHWNGGTLGSSGDIAADRNLDRNDGVHLWNFNIAVI